MVRTSKGQGSRRGEEPGRVDVEAGWTALVGKAGETPFAHSDVCKDAFARIPAWLGLIRLEMTATPETLSAVGLEILRDGRTAETLREAGFRFEIPRDRALPWILAVNGSQAQRDLVAPPGDAKPTVADVLSAWPQMIITFAPY